MANLTGDSANPAVPGVFGENTAGGDGVFGFGGDNGRGVVGVAKAATAVEGNSTSGTGVWGSSQTGEGVHGETNSTTVAAGAFFQLNPNSNTTAVFAEHRGNGPALWGVSKTGEAVHGETNSTTVAAGAFFQLNPNSDTAALFAKHNGNRTAAVFVGNVIVTGDITLANADCAEHFDISDAASVEPGTVMVLGEEGTLHQSQQAYDKRVASVVSGAGNYKPGLVLDKQQSQLNRKPIALLGKVYCKVDAQFGAIEVGDLLTTSSTPGHAMRADDPMKAFGTVIGKALRPLKEGQGLIPILVTLQ